MGLYTSFVSRIAFPLHERIKGHDTTRIRKALERSQWFSEDRIERDRFVRLKTFLAAAGRHVPYYRKLYAEHGIDPEAFVSLHDLARIPFLDKSLIKAYIEELKSVNATRLAKFNTGGSSGEPLIFYLGQRVNHDVAAKWRATRWWNVDIGDKEIVLWGSPIELGAQDLFKTLRDRLLRSSLLSAFDLSEQQLDRYIGIIRRSKPKMLFGYPSVISLLAQHARDRGIDLGDTGVKVAFVTAERLYDWQKSVIEAVFNCRVANGYGGRDAGFIAHECPDGGMHINAEDIIVEIIDERGRLLPPGQAGEIVVTHMATGDFPFIRYRTGDIAALGTRCCACGRGLPVLQSIEGRTTDFIVTASGKRLHGLSLIYVLRELPEIREFRIIQEEAGRLRVLIVPGEDYRPDIDSVIRDGFVQRTDPDMQVDIELMDEIPITSSGKYRFVISKISGQTAIGGG